MIEINDGLIALALILVALVALVLWLGWQIEKAEDRERNRWWR